MSFLDGLFGRRSVKLTDAAGWFRDTSSSAGKLVTQETALQLSTAWRCVRLRSRVMGAMPIMAHERLPDGSSRRAKGFWLDDLIHESPNVDQTPAEFWGGMVASVDLWGNAYAKIERIGERIVALNPMRPDLVTVYRKDGQRRYRYSAPTGMQDLASRDVFHLRGFNIGGDVGLSAISYGRQTLGLGLASEETAGNMVANGLQISGFVELADGTKMTPDQSNMLIDLFAKFMGSKKAGKVMPLPPGAKFQGLSMSPVDVELLSSRRFTVEEICRWFDTPPILAGHAGDGQTMWGSGVEQILLGWVTLDLDPFLTNIQQAVRKQLLSPVERLKYFAEYNREALLQADSTAKAAFLSQMAQNGFITRNEGRAKLNQPRMEGGDVLTVQSNLIPLDQLGKTPPRAVQPAPGDPVN
ncbi:phage portal protein [Phenylobacterium sp.]|uniref:phage portal protein n=1 Tax=Phenylobacterium sp. TaxID=1871053 RepID=UPI00392C801B